MTARYQRLNTEELELEQKRSELTSLRAQRAEAEAVLRQLREEISGFERSYHETLGRRMAELERIETEIARLTGAYVEEEVEPESESDEQDDFQDRETYRRGRSFQESGAGSKGRVWKADEQDIKALYREVAKAIHPDLAGEGSRSVRHELMLKANKAYEEEDGRTLREILRSWKKYHPEQQGAANTAAELAHVQRQIAVELQAIREVNTQVEQLRASYVCRFKLRVDQSLAAGSDLFAEMIAAADVNIARALRRLAVLKEERGRHGSAAHCRERKSLIFPEDVSCGLLYIRDVNSSNFSQWKKAGPAIGVVEVFVDQALRLDVKEQVGESLRQLQALRPHDLQALFLYDVCDADLDNIVHLTGLEELYLCGPHLTDAALLCISSLTGLQRIYLYQTAISDRGLVYLQGLQGLKGLTSSGNSITEEGLAVFQKAIPGVKTVSFKWRR